MRLVEIISRASIDVDLRSTSKPEVLAELAGLLARSLPEVDPEEIARTLVDRERLATTGVGEGIAIPHGKLAGIRRIVGALGIARTGIPFDAVDGRPVRILVGLLAPPESTGDHLKALARISQLFKVPALRERLIDSPSAEEAWRIIGEEDGRHRQGQTDLSLALHLTCSIIFSSKGFVMSGLNTEVSYEHEIYHVQTQDKGPGANYVETILYKGGRVLSSRRAYYTSLLGRSDLAQRIADFIKAEHETAITEIEQGKFSHL